MLLPLENSKQSSNINPNTQSTKEYPRGRWEWADFPLPLFLVRASVYPKKVTTPKQRAKENFLFGQGQGARSVHFAEKETLLVSKHSSYNNISHIRQAVLQQKSTRQYKEIQINIKSKIVDWQRNKTVAGGTAKFAITGGTYHLSGTGNPNFRCKKHCYYERQTSGQLTFCCCGHALIPPHFFIKGPPQIVFQLPPENEGRSRTVAPVRPQA